MYRSMIVAIVAMTALILNPASASAETKPEVTPAQRLSAYVQPSIVYLETFNTAVIRDTYDGLLLRKSDKPFVVSGSCTGFILTEDGYIGSAGHCVNHVDEGFGIDTRNDIFKQGVAYSLENGLYGKTVSAERLYEYALQYWVIENPANLERIRNPIRTVSASWGANVSGLEAQKRLPARVIKSQTVDGGDTALLKVNAKDLNALPLYTEDDVETGTDIASVGYPGKVDQAVDDDYTPSIKTGAISSKKTVGGNSVSVYEVDAAVAPGMSGGPTVNLEGEVIGVNSFGAGDSEQFNFIQPTANLLEVTNGEGVKPQLGEQAKTYRKGLDAYFDGDKKVAVANLQKVVDDQPANGIAKDYLVKAKDLPDPKKPKEDSNFGWVIGVVLAVLVLGLLAALFWWMRMRKSVPPFRCSNCGEVRDRNLKFCGACGYSEPDVETAP